MAFNEVLDEEILTEFKTSEDSDREETTHSSLNPKINRDFQPKKSVYYKNPSIQLIVVISCGIPLIWLVLSAFSSPKPSKEVKVKPVDEEKVKMQKALDEERKAINQLQKEKALEKQQKIEAIILEPEPEPEPEPKELETKVDRPPVSQPPPPKPIPQYQPVAVRQNVVPKSEPAIENIEPEVDPMERWLASANSGHYVTARGRREKTLNIANRTGEDDSFNSMYEETYNRKTQISQTNKESTLPDNNISKNVEITDYPSYSDSSIQERLSSSVALLDSKEIEERLKYPSRKPSQTIDRRRHSRRFSAEAVRETDDNNSSSINNLEEKYNSSNKNNHSSSRTQQWASNFSQQELRQNISSNRTSRTIGIGTSIKATLESSVVWTSNNTEPNGKKYLLQLQEGLKSVTGEEILPENTRAIAVVKESSNSGLVFMEVTHLIEGTRKIAIPSGVVQIEGKNGSPLKAKLKRKGDSDFLTDLVTIAAPGVSEAMGSLADSADTLVFEEGDRSLLRTRNGNSNPLASGISGLADGAENVLNRRLQRNINNESILSYFQLDSGKTVHLVVYEDFSL